MNNHPAYHLIQHKQRRNIVLVVSILMLVLATISMDYLQSQFQNGNFYISESILFSSYWLLFLPLLKIQWKLNRYHRELSLGLFIIFGIALIHLLCYPALVWLLSKIFYSHTFLFNQTFDFGLTAYFIKTIIIYSSSFFIMVIYQNKLFPYSTISRQKNEREKKFITSLIVRDGKNERMVIETVDIFYFSANSPYVNIHHKTRNFLENDTLKSLGTKLDSSQFVRIHKSCIVNISKVVSYQSRQNGDYDITLTDGATLRVSRNYAAVFKMNFEKRHHLTRK